MRIIEKYYKYMNCTRIFFFRKEWKGCILMGLFSYLSANDFAKINSENSCLLQQKIIFGPRTQNKAFQISAENMHHTEELWTVGYIYAAKKNTYHSQTVAHRIKTINWVLCYVIMNYYISNKIKMLKTASPSPLRRLI